MTVTTYLAILTDGVTELQVCFDQTSDMLDDLIHDAFFSPSDEDMERLDSDKKVWLVEIRNALTGRLVYFNDMPKMPETIQGLRFEPIPGAECFSA